MHTIGHARFVITINPTESIKLAGQRLLVVHEWALTVNKSQGSTFERDLLDLRGKYWEHGTAYVVLGRSQTAATTGAFVDDASSVAAGAGNDVRFLCASRSWPQCATPRFSPVDHQKLLTV